MEANVLQVVQQLLLSIWSKHVEITVIFLHKALFHPISSWGYYFG